MKLEKFCKAFKEKIKKDASYPQGYKNNDQPYICSILNECLSLLKSEKGYKNVLSQDQDEDQIQAFLTVLRLLLEIFYENIEKNTLLEIFSKIEKKLTSELTSNINDKVDIYDKVEILDNTLKGLYIRGNSIEFILSGKPFDTDEDIMRIATCSNIKHYLDAKEQVTFRMIDKDQVREELCKKIERLFYNNIDKVVLGSWKFKLTKSNIKVHNLFVTRSKEVEDFKKEHKGPNLLSSLLSHLGMSTRDQDPDSRDIFTIKVNLRESDKKIVDFHTPTFFDAFPKDSFSYFIPTPTEKSHVGNGHWGKTFNLLYTRYNDDNPYGLSEAVIREIDCAKVIDNSQADQESVKKKCLLNREEGKIIKDNPDSKKEMFEVLVEKILKKYKEEEIEI